MSNWMPIETAPKIGEKNILLLTLVEGEDYETSIAVGFWGDIFAGMREEKRLGWCDWSAGLGSSDIWVEVIPTHWMPLPEPPK